MSTSLRLVAGVLLTAPALVSAAWGDAGTTGAPKPVLVAKGKGYLVHAVPNPAAGREMPDRVPGGLQLLYTSLPGGEMKVLAATGTWTSFRTRRPRYGQSRLAGVAADAERLYVLTWERSGWDSPPADTPAGPRKAGEAAPPGRYRLSVFWLADGSPVHAQPLGGGDIPPRAPQETTAQGPLRLTRDGVSCYRTAVSFKGKGVTRAVTSGVVKAIEEGGILLDSGVRVVVNEGTRYAIETGRDPREARLSDVAVGKAVQVVTEDKGGQAVAVRVMVSRVQPIGR